MEATIPIICLANNLCISINKKKEEERNEKKEQRKVEKRREVISKMLNSFNKF